MQKTTKTPLIFLTDGFRKMKVCAYAYTRPPFGIGLPLWRVYVYVKAVNRKLVLSL